MSPRVIGPRIAAGIAVLALGGLALASTYAEAAWRTEESFSLSEAAIAVEASPETISYACPPGILDPFAFESRQASAQQWSSIDGWAPADDMVLTAHIDNAQPQLPSGMVVSAQTGGELRGLAAVPCVGASIDQWLSVGATTVGEDLLVVLANPAPIPSVVTISALGPVGPAGSTHQVTVPADSSTVVTPGTWFPDLSRLALRIEADGPGVAAWAQSSAMAGEQPLGLAWTPASAAAQSLVFPGIPEGVEATVRISSTSTESTQVELSYVTAQGSTNLDEKPVDLDPGTILDIPLGTIPSGGVTLQVEADQPVAAHLFYEQAGQKFGSTNKTWTSRVAFAQSQAITTVQLPGLEEIRTQVDTVAKEKPLRPSQIDPRTGHSATTARLHLAVPSGDQPVEVTVGQSDKVITVDAGTAAVIDLPDQPTTLSSTHPVYATVVLTVDTETGPLTAAWPLGGRLPVTERGTVLVWN